MDTNLATVLPGTLSRLGFLALLVVLLLLPLWLVRYPPVVDYPDHLARSFILVHLKDPAYRFGGFYSSDWGPYPYLGMDVLLVTLQHFLPAETAGRVLLSVCVLAVPIAGWWFLRQANPGHDELALWTLLLSFSPFFLGGFINFQLGLALGFCTVGLWLLYLEKPTAMRWLALLAAATSCYFMHLVAFGLAAFVVLVYSLAKPVPLRRMLWSVGAFLPGAVLYFVSRIGAFNGNETKFRPLAEKLTAARDALFLSYSHRLEAGAVWIFVICVLAAWLRNREFQWNRCWLVVFSAVAVLYVLAPNRYGKSWYLDVRLIPALFLLLLCVAKIGRRQRALGFAALAIFCMRTADVVRGFRSQQPALWTMERAIQTLPRNVRLMPIVNVDTDNDLLHQVYNHVWAYTIIERGSLAPYLFDFPGQTPLRVTKNLYAPVDPADDPDTRPPDWQQVKGSYDYVWTYNADFYRDYLLDIGTEIYHAGDLRVYRLQTRAK